MVVVAVWLVGTSGRTGRVTLVGGGAGEGRPERQVTRWISKAACVPGALRPSSGGFFADWNPVVDRVSFACR